MTRQLNLYFDSIDPVNSVAFSFVENGQIIDSATMPLKSIISNYNECDVAIIIPGEQVLSLQISAPNGSLRHLAQALPYLLEDELAAPVETLHIVATKKRDADGKLLCAVIDKNLLRHYLQLLGECGISPLVMIPDYWTLPKPNSLNIVQKEQRLLIRLSTNNGLALPITIDRSLLLKLCPELSTQQLENIPQWQASHSCSAPLNLLQGEFSPPRKANRLAWIKPTAITISVCFAIFISYLLILGWHFNQQSEELKNQAAVHYKTLFPNDRRIVDIRRQMQAHLKQTSATENDSLFFKLLSALSTAKEAQDELSTIRNIRFDQDSTFLQLEFQTTSINYANTMQNHLQGSGLIADILSANSNAEGVVVRLRIQPRPSQ